MRFRPAHGIGRWNSTRRQIKGQIGSELCRFAFTKDRACAVLKQVLSKKPIHFIS